MTPDEPLPADEDEARFDAESSAIGRPAPLETPDRAPAPDETPRPRGALERLLAVLRPRRRG